MTHVLHLDAGAAHAASITRRLASHYLDALRAGQPGITVTHRDLSAGGIGFVNTTWIHAAENETIGPVAAELIAEPRAADVLLITCPVYNFSIPAALKAWIDQVARAGVTFAFTPDGPKGLLEHTRAVIITASGGTEIGGSLDFATPYLRHLLAYSGIDDIEIVAADLLRVAPDRVESAERRIEALVG